MGRLVVGVHSYLVVLAARVRKGFERDDELVPQFHWWHGHPSISLENSTLFHWLYYSCLSIHRPSVVVAAGYGTIIVPARC